jgi:hypothetical protein
MSGNAQGTLQNCPPVPAKGSGVAERAAATAVRKAAKRASSSKHHDATEDQDSVPHKTRKAGRGGATRAAEGAVTTKLHMDGRGLDALREAIAAEELQLRALEQRRDERHALAADLAIAKASFGLQVARELDAAVARTDAFSDAIEASPPARAVEVDRCASVSAPDASLHAGRGHMMRDAVHALRGHLGIQETPPSTGPSAVLSGLNGSRDQRLHGRRLYGGDPAVGERQHVDPHREAGTDASVREESDPTPSWLADDSAEGESAKPSCDLLTAAETLSLVESVLEMMQRHAEDVSQRVLDACELDVRPDDPEGPAPAQPDSNVNRQSIPTPADTDYESDAFENDV